MSGKDCSLLCYAFLRGVCLKTVAGSTLVSRACFMTVSPKKANGRPPLLGCVAFELWYCGARFLPSFSLEASASLKMEAN